jgi:hypothetical protein
MEAMRRKLKYKVFSLALILALAACSTETEVENPGGNKIPPELESLAQKAIQNLTRHGCEVARGYMRLFTIEDCASSIAVTGQCFGNNPTAPYVMPVLPSWPEEYVDPTEKGVFGQTLEGYSTVWRLDPREAVLVMGGMPPAGRYFGFQTYQFSREGQIDTMTGQYQFLSQFPAMMNVFFKLAPSGRLLSFASLSDSINNAVIAEQACTAFGQVRTILVTADRAMDNAVRASLAEAGVTAATVFTEPIPSSMKVGLEKEADDFMSVMRYAMPEDPQQGEAWRRDLPLVVLRVRDRSASRPTEPYPPFTQAQARTAADETGLAADLAALQNNVRAAWGLPPAVMPPKLTDRLIDMQRTYPIDLFGPHCQAHTMNCLGDTQDTTYMASMNLPLETESGQRLLYAVVGTLGTRTGNATYVSLSYNRAAVMQGVGNVGDDQLELSQASFPRTPAPFANGDKFFVWYFGRDCSRVNTGNCSEVPESLIPRGEALKIILRNYLRPGTARGANSEPAGDPRGTSPLLTPWVIAIPLDQ